MSPEVEEMSSVNSANIKPFIYLTEWSVFAKTTFEATLLWSLKNVTKCNEMLWNPRIVDHAVTSREILTASIHIKTDDSREMQPLNQVLMNLRRRGLKEEGTTTDSCQRFTVMHRGDNPASAAGQSELFLNVFSPRFFFSTTLNSASDWSPYNKSHTWWLVT